MIEDFFEELGFNDINQYREKIIYELGHYTDMITNSDGSLSYIDKTNSYFLENNKWHIDFFKDIQRLKPSCEKYNSAVKNIMFEFNNNNLNLEMKYIVINKLFSSQWNFMSLLYCYGNVIKHLSRFINNLYPNINSFMELDKDKARLQWVDWLNKEGRCISKQIQEATNGKIYSHRTNLLGFLENTYDYLFKILDLREEWEKDQWDVRNLVKYGLEYNKTAQNHHIIFTGVKNVYFRKLLKKYCKNRLIGKNNFKTSTAQSCIVVLSRFLNFIFTIQPLWKDLVELSRNDFEKYIEYINVYSTERLTQVNANPKNFIIGQITTVKAFLEYIQLRDYIESPKTNISRLIFNDDKPKRKKRTDKVISYVPEDILENFIRKLNYLHHVAQPIVLVMLYTGMRISDVLSLKHNCLINMNNQYWIETDILKTSTMNHRIPIDNKIADMLAVLISESKKISNKDNNPDNYIFCRYSGRRKGTPYTQGWMRQKLCDFARKNDITDNEGNIFHFYNHIFRHTYAVRMLNNGVDIIVLQDLLAHASPEMTLVYAKLLDDTKKKAFEKAVKNGVFSFDECAKLKEENNGEVPTDVLDMLWTNHKLNAIDTPYGTCLQRTNGKCSFAKQPPCLTCNSGNPCRDLCVGAFEGDIKKYEILINSTKSLIESAKVYNRKEMAKENEELLNLYEDIQSKIIEGNIIYSRLDRLKKTGDTNE